MKKLTIALVAHDNRKAEMVEWAVHNAEFLSHHHIVCTGTTGNLVRKALEEKGVNADIACMHSGPMGGDAEIAAMVESVRRSIWRSFDRRLESATARGRHPDVASPVPCS